MRLAAVVLLLAGCSAPAEQARTERLNILLICVDDFKPLAGCYGGAAKTPNLDRLASRGVIFDKAYCNQAVCSPSRNALLTGLRPTSTGIYDLGTNFRKATPDAVTLPQHFKNHGWRTEALGKIFHVGHGNHEDPASWSVPHWKSNVVAYAKPGAGQTREEALFANKGAAGLPRGPAYENADVADTAYPDGAVADEAIRRLRAAQSKPGEPFFLAVGFVKPHLPFCAPKKYWDLYDPAALPLPALRTAPQGAPSYAPTTWGELRQYGGIPETGPLPDDLARTLIHGYHAAVSYMDAQLGRVLDALDASRTLVIFWGDHGWHLGDHGQWCKHSNYEQAARIPFVVAGPGVASGRRSSALVESVDLYPTLCGLAGLPVPSGLDGASFEAQLRDPDRPGKEAILHVYPRGPRLGRAVRTARHRLVEWKRPGAPADTAEVELYDYERDPAETRNLAAEQPQQVAELRAILTRYSEAKPPIKP